MALTEASGTHATTTSPGDLFASQTTLKAYATMIFFNLLQSGDSIEIVIYVKDIVGATERIFDKFTVTGPQSAIPSTYIPPLPTASYRVTAQTITGSDRDITWVRSDFI